MTTRADLERMGYTVDVAPDGSIASVRGFGLAITTSRELAGEAFAAIADEDAHAERVFQHTRPDVHAAQRAIVAAGYEVERLDRAGDTFKITAPKGSRMTPAPTRPVTADELGEIVERLRAAT